MKYLFQFSAFACLLFALAGCGKKMAQPEFGTIGADTLLQCGTVRNSVQYTFTTIANAESDPALKAIEEANIQYFFGLEGFTGTAQEALAETLGLLQEELCKEQVPIGTPEFLCESTEQQESSATVIDTVLVYTITSFTNAAGAAHPMHTLMVHNYSLPGGFELTLADLFDDAQRAALETLIRIKLYTQYGVSDDDGLAQLGFFPEQIALTENFAITPEGVTFYYNPYDIGCYALGDVKVEINKEDLKTIGIE